MPVPLTQLEGLIKMVTGGKPKMYVYYTYERQETDALMKSYSPVELQRRFSNTESFDGRFMKSMRVYSYKTKTLFDVASKVGGLLVMVKLLAYILFNFLLTRSFWRDEAEHILSHRKYKTESVDVVQDRMKQRLSFCAIYKLFDQVEEVERRLDQVQREHEIKIEELKSRITKLEEII